MMSKQTIIQVTEHDSIEEIVSKMVEHSRSYESHGPNCACKDECVRALRRRFPYRSPERTEFEYLCALILRSNY